MPVILRVSVGSKYGAQHSQDWSALCAHIPGLKVVFPATPYDAKGLMTAALNGTDPVVFFESQRVYGFGEEFNKAGVPEGHFEIPFGEPDVKKEGKDITIVATGVCVDSAVKAAEMLAADGICYVDLIIINKGKAMVDIGTGEIVAIDDTPILSTMAFYVNVYESSVDNSVIESSYEYDGLNEALKKAEADYAEIIQLSKSYAIGNAGGIRDGEDTDNSKYYYEKSLDSANKSAASEANAKSYMNTSFFIEKAKKIIDITLPLGIDKEHFGIIAFTDLDGKPPVQLEWDMKLWWPQCETIIALRLAYTVFKEEKYLKLYEEFKEYCEKYFVDNEDGEWYGYLHYDNTVSNTLKGNIFKGPFHIPRLYIIMAMMDEFGGIEEYMK